MPAHLCGTYTTTLLRYCLALGALTFAIPAGAQVYGLDELNSSDFRGLDPKRTVFLIPSGVIEEHGPHLPLGNDSFLVEWLAERVAESIVGRTGWKVVVFPTIPVGVGGPEDFAPRPRTFGSLPLRPETKRAVLMDLASGLGEAGFSWIFVIDVHGPLVNKRMTDQAAQFFEDTYGGTMLNLAGVEHPTPPAKVRPLTQEEFEEDGRAVHAGLIETSMTLFVRPDLVSNRLNDLPLKTPKEWSDLQRLASEDDWTGYYGSPRLARPDIGSDRMLVWAANLSDLAIKVLDGLDHRALPRRADSENFAFRALDDNIAEHAKRIREQQLRWLEVNGIR